MPEAKRDQQAADDQIDHHRVPRPHVPARDLKGRRRSREFGRDGSQCGFLVSCERLLNELPKHMASLYARISARIRDGVAVAEARNGACMACFMALRPQAMAQVRRAQVMIGESVPFAAWIDVDDLPNVNTHHFSADSQLIIGRRFGEALLRLKKN